MSQVVSWGLGLATAWVNGKLDFFAFTFSFEVRSELLMMVADFIEWAPCSISNPEQLVTSNIFVLLQSLTKASFFHEAIFKYLFRLSSRIVQHLFSHKVIPNKEIHLITH
jgi:hypothetical protein